MANVVIFYAANILSNSPGARFGPAGIRDDSRRLNLYGGYNVPMDVNPFGNWDKIFDCDDIAVTPYDKKFAINQNQFGHQELHRKPSIATSKFPRLITLGGDYTITMPWLLSIHSAYRPISVIHLIPIWILGSPRSLVVPSLIKLLSTMEYASTMPPRMD